MSLFLVNSYVPCFGDIGWWMKRSLRGFDVCDNQKIGHEVPLHRLQQAFILFNHFLNNKPMPRKTLNVQMVQSSQTQKPNGLSISFVGALEEAKTDNNTRKKTWIRNSFLNPKSLA